MTSRSNTPVLSLAQVATAAVASIVDRGAVFTAPEVAELVCGSRVGARWVIEHMGPTIGSKPGRTWYFYESDARAWWAKRLEQGRSRRIA